MSKIVILSFLLCSYLPLFAMQKIKKVFVRFIEDKDKKEKREGKMFDAIQAFGIDAAKFLLNEENSIYNSAQQLTQYKDCEDYKEGLETVERAIAGLPQWAKDKIEKHEEKRTKIEYKLFGSISIVIGLAYTGYSYGNGISLVKSICYLGAVGIGIYVKKLISTYSFRKIKINQYKEGLKEMRERQSQMGSILENLLKK